MGHATDNVRQSLANADASLTAARGVLEHGGQELSVVLLAAIALAFVGAVVHALAAIAWALVDINATMQNRP